VNIFVEQGHARLPVFRDLLENVVGIVYARDLLYILRDKGLFLLQDLVHDAYFIGPTPRSANSSRLSRTIKCRLP